MPSFPVHLWRLMLRGEKRDGVLKHFVSTGFERRPNTLKTDSIGWLSAQNASVAERKKHVELQSQFDWFSSVHRVSE